MSKEAEIRLRVTPELKRQATEVFSTWGLNLTDAITVFLAQSVRVGGMPFELRRLPTPRLENSEILPPAPGHTSTVLPADWDDDAEDYSGY